jgi:hypothetical protein
VYFNDYQQNPMGTGSGSAPTVNVYVSNNTDDITAGDFIAVPTVISGSDIRVLLMAKVTDSYEQWNYTPQMVSVGANSQMYWTPNDDGIHSGTPTTTLPTTATGGTNTTGTYDITNTPVLMLSQSSSNPTIEQDNATVSTVSGAMYYNSTLNSFRCGYGTAWVSCTGLVNAQTGATNTLSATGSGVWATFSSGTNYTYTLPANDCQAGVVYDITAAGLYSNVATFKVKTSLYVDSLGTNLAAGTPSAQDPTDGVHNASSFGWIMHAEITCTAANTYQLNGTLTYDNAAGESNTQILYNDSSSTLTANASHTIGVEYFQNTSNASDTLTMYQFVVVRHG